MADIIKLEEIENIKDFMEGMAILGERNLDHIEGIFDVDDIKEILRLKYYPKNLEDPSNSRKSKLYKNYAKLKIALKDQLRNVKEIIRLPSFQSEFGEIYKISEERIMEKQNKLEELIERKSFPILTAGEAKAGKSTLINLLLGTDLMPMDLVTCTRMICEVRNSPNRKATFIVDENRSDLNQVIELGDNAMEGIATKVKCEDSVKYVKGKFEYPVDFLDEFTYLVDSPGIGDTTPLEKITFDFLNENAPAFIFVLNSTNSNGLNLKAKELISKARNELTKESNFFITDESSMKPNKYSGQEIDKAIFILNHWDVVRSNAKSKEEVEEVRNTIIKEIKMLWHESVAEGVQIFFLSALQAKQWHKEKLIQTDLIKLRQSLTNLVVKLYERNFFDCLGFLNEILDYIERKILQKINTNVDNKYCRLYDRNHAEELCRLLENIMLKTDDRRKRITEDLAPKLMDMTASLTLHLKSPDVETRILELTKSKISVEKSIDFLTIVLKKILENQLYEELKIWEKESNQIEQLYSYLNSLFEQHLVEISNQINVNNMLINKDTLLSAWNSTNSKEIRKLDNEIITKIEQVFIITTITLLFPVVALAGLLATPLILSYMIKEKKSSTESLKKYEKDPDGYIRKIIRDSLGSLSENDVRRCFFKNLSDKCKEHIRAFDEFIKAELLEKRQLIKDIENEYRAMPEILNSLNKLLTKTEKCYGEYHLLQNAYHPDETLMKRSTHYLRNEETKPETSETLILGKNSVVFRSTRFKNTLFKMYVKPFKGQFARFQMQELDILVTPPFQYILRLKHLCYLEKEEKLLLVLENVDCNLHAYLNEQRDLVPVYHEKGSQQWKRAYRFIVDVAKQLCNCLMYLHGCDRRMVHPDLKIDTILVSKTKSPDKVNIFICDACANLPTQRHHKKSGNLPEEQIEHYFDMGGYTKENIYRLGIVLYKLAYLEFERHSRPKSASAVANLLDELETAELSIESMEHDINITWNEKKHEVLPVEYNDIVKLCISKHPQNRPDAKTCYSLIDGLDISEC